ncbi:LysR family transcriptional regulator [Martelella sp. AMO21009]
MASTKIPDRQSGAYDIDISALRIFVAIAETGSFVGGAKVVGLTRSAAGKGMARLERHLGTRLFHRTTRQVSLTTDGQTFYERCVQILQDLEEAEASVMKGAPAPHGTLRVTVSEAYGRIVLIPFLKSFLQTWPNLKIEVSFTDRLVDLVEEGFDLGIRVGRSFEGAQLIARVINRTRPHLYASPAYINEKGVPPDLLDLGGHQRLIYGSNAAGSLWTLIDPDGKTISIDTPSQIRFSSGDAIRSATIEGMGIGFLPEFLVEKDVEENRLVRLFPNHAGEEICIHAIYPSRRYFPARVRVFLDSFLEYL